MFQGYWEDLLGGANIFDEFVSAKVKWSQLLLQNEVSPIHQKLWDVLVWYQYG